MVINLARNNDIMAKYPKYTVYVKNPRFAEIPNRSALVSRLVDEYFKAEKPVLEAKAVENPALSYKETPELSHKTALSYTDYPTKQDENDDIVLEYGLF